MNQHTHVLSYMHLCAEVQRLANDPSSGVTLRGDGAVIVDCWRDGDEAKAVTTIKRTRRIRALMKGQHVNCH